MLCDLLKKSANKALPASGIQQIESLLIAINDKASLKNKTQFQVFVQTMSSPIGEIAIAATQKGICFLEFIEPDKIEFELAKLVKKFQATLTFKSNQYTDLARQQLKNYFAGKLLCFTIPFDIQGTDFQRLVWQSLTNIPYGETCSYLKQAQSINHPKAVRAVASSNGANLISIMIPCHRIIGSNGQLTGYAGGLWRKKWLLEFEQKNK